MRGGTHAQFAHKHLNRARLSAVACCRSIPSPAAEPAAPQVLGFPGSTASGVFILSTAPDSAQPSPKSPPGMGSFTPASSQLRVGSSSKRSEAGSLTSDRYSLMAVQQRRLSCFRNPAGAYCHVHDEFDPY